MNIKQKIEKIKSYENDIILIIVVVCVTFISFGLGRLSTSAEKTTPITVKNMATVLAPVASPPTTSVDTKLLVASKNSTKYHYPWCSGAQRIKDSNKIWFDSTEEAREAGYTPASNCKGL